MSKRIEIARDTGLSFSSAWDHRLICSFCADGSVSLSVEIHADGGVVRLKGARGIRNGEQFLAGLKIASDFTSIEEIIDYELACSAIASHNPKLADEIIRIIEFDGEPKLSAIIHDRIGKILSSPALYPAGCYGTMNRRLRYERTRAVLLKYYDEYGQLPERSIEVDGFEFNFV